MKNLKDPTRAKGKIMKRFFLVLWNTAQVYWKKGQTIQLIQNCLHEIEITSRQLFSTSSADVIEIVTLGKFKERMKKVRQDIMYIAAHANKMRDMLKTMESLEQ
jgi:hypothetical protein